MDTRDAANGPDTALATLRQMALLPLADVAERAHDYAHQAKAPNTWRAYRSDWRDFAAWCSDHGLPSLPAEPQTVALYLSALAPTHKTSTLRRRLSAVAQAHKAAGHPSPTKAPEVALPWQGIRRTHGTAELGKAPILTADLRALVAALPDSPLGARDRALLLVGFAGAFRRSELVALDVADVEFTRLGLVVTIRRSKTDQEGQGRQLGIPHGADPATCPVRALRAWLDTAAIVEGPIFRPLTRHGAILPGRLSDKAVALVVKRAALAAGLDPRRYAGHSLRSGLATSAAAAGASERAIMNQTGHKSLTVARRYIRAGSLFRENAAAALGL